MTLPFYKNMLQFSGRSCSYKNGAQLAKFQPGVLNPFVRTVVQIQTRAWTRCLDIT